MSVPDSSDVIHVRQLIDYVPFLSTPCELKNFRSGHTPDPAMTALIIWSSGILEDSWQPTCMRQVQNRVGLQNSLYKMLRLLEDCTCSSPLFRCIYACAQSPTSILAVAGIGKARFLGIQ